MNQPWLPVVPANLVLGTSSFSWADWNGVFYPDGLPEAERIGFYARWFPAVEVDATFYRMPSRAMISSWRAKTPDHFRFALKVPQQVTHEHGLAHSDAAVAELLEVTDGLGERRGPLLLQFPYVAKGADAREYETGQRFLADLAAWLPRWAEAADWVLEVRNAAWLRGPLLDLLRQYQVPLALTAYYTMPSLARLQEQGVDPVTGPFAYVRFLGDRRRIDERLDTLLAAGEIEQRFGQLIWDRERELRQWVDRLLPIVARMRTWAFFNNHYAGFGPGSARMFAELWREIHGTD